MVLNQVQTEKYVARLKNLPQQSPCNLSGRELFCQGYWQALVTVISAKEIFEVINAFTRHYVFFPERFKLLNSRILYCIIKNLEIIFFLKLHSSSTARWVGWDRRLLCSAQCAYYEPNYHQHVGREVPSSLIDEPSCHIVIRWLFDWFPAFVKTLSPLASDK